MRMRILLSYHYYKDTRLETLFQKYFAKPYPEVFIDSGGFSAMSQGVTIDIDAYCDYIKANMDYISTYAVLDAIGDAEKTLKNQRYMESKGLRPLPCFHVGEDFKYLERYIAEYPYIALGGMVPHLRDAKKLMPWIIKCFKMAQGKSVFHGFGATSWTVIKALPWYSVDSSSWGQGFRFGQVPLFDERAGQFVDIRLGDHASCYKYAPIIRELGFSAADFANRDRNDRATICAISALGYLKAEKWLRKRHGPVHIPTREGERDNVGLKLHIADGSGQNLGDASKGVAVYVGNRDPGLKLHLAEANSNANDIRRALSVLNGGQLDA